MKKMIKSVMMVAVAATLLVSCAKDLTNEAPVKPGMDVEGVTLRLSAAVADSRMSSVDMTKLNFEATDELGVFLVGSESGLDKNLKATMPEGGTPGQFEVTGAKVAAGNLYAYYPYNQWADSSTSAEDVWVCIPQGQEQSAPGKFEAANYLTMVAGPVAIAADMKVDFQAVGSILALDIYDTSAKYTSQKIKSVEVLSYGAADAMLVGGYPYNMTTKAFDYIAGGPHKAAVVKILEPAAVASASGQGVVYMAVVPGQHTLRVKVTTDGGAYVFKMQNPVTCTAGKLGTIKLNLARSEKEEYLVFQDFSLMIWGSIRIPVYGTGWSAKVNASGAGDAFATAPNGEEPYFYACTGDAVDGAGSFDVMKDAHYLVSRDLEGWGFSKVYEHQGHIKVGTGSAGWSLSTPVLSMLSENETIEFSVDIVKRQATTDNIHIKVEGAGTIEGATDAVLDIPKPGSAQEVPNNIKTVKYTIEGANSSTKVTLYSENTNKSYTRCYIDNVIVKRASKDDGNSLVYGGVTYKTVTLKDGNTWMAENLRYVPDGKTVTALSDDYTGTTNDGIFYPATYAVVSGAAVVTPSSDGAVVAAQGLLYTAAAAMNGETIPSTDWADCTNTRGICPEGWHIPTAQEWVDLVGACANSAHNNTSAPYYDQSLSGADLAALNTDGFNLLPYPFVNQGKKYLGSYLNKREGNEYNVYASMCYFQSSTGRSATQNYAAMITNNNTKTSVNCAYSMLTNAAPVRCVKNK